MGEAITMKSFLRPFPKPPFPLQNFKKLLIIFLLLNIFFLVIFSWYLSDFRLLMAGRPIDYSLWRLGLLILILVIVGGSNFWFISDSLRSLYLLKTKTERTEKLAYIGTLASGLAHEIRNPLNSFSINLQLLEEELRSLPATEGRNLVRILRQEIQRLEEILSEFLRFTRPPLLHPEARDINQIVNDVLNFIEPESRAHNITVVRNLASNLPRVLVDEKQIKQVFINLILNAQEAMSQGGVLTISTRKDGRPIPGEKVPVPSISSHDNHLVLVEIADTGVGIPEKDRQRIFELFYSTKKGGTGLGLPIVQRIVEDHGGEIFLHSTEGKGTKFIVALKEAREEIKS